ncbi:hypothetical protein [Microbacterium sp. SORGH_AS_0862]|uniref:hypothetical protein n=1 Tax=Microbacterium sp. SORGH_AS_0862 TaxID=3041789 RepID=UPI002794FF86|nr:hypothetical protein [Microbacterium sp. SORGH_AS_0862]MDQ1206190.1 hypothetical protein [Microbacterium sp. SORGH_AS_0862]
MSLSELATPHAPYRALVSSGRWHVSDDVLHDFLHKVSASTVRRLNVMRELPRGNEPTARERAYDAETARLLTKIREAQR